MVTTNTENILTGRVTPDMAEARDFYSGDLWRKGQGLAVKKPTDSAKLSEIKEGFATQNVVEEVVDRRRDGILGREPAWALLPNEGDATDTQINSIREMTDAIVHWWNKRGMLELMREMLVGGCLERRAEIRPFAPKTAYDGKSLKSARTLEEALDLLYFTVVSPKQAGVFTQEDSMKPYSVYEYVAKDEQVIEISLTDDEGRTHLARLKESDSKTFADQNFPTIAKYMANRAAADERFDYEPMDLNGHLYLYEMDLNRPFVSPPMLGLQKQISLGKTMQGRNTWTAGFRSKHWLNARAPQGEKKIADPAEPSGYRIEKFDKPMKDGAGVNSFVQGALLRDDSGKIIGVATPNVVITDPVSVGTFIESTEDCRAGILAMADQLHVLMADKATASGVSRVEARGEFTKDLKNVKVPVDGLGRYIIEFAMMFAANLTDRVGEFKEFRCDFNAIVDSGVLSPEEKEDNRNAYRAGEISLETLMSRNGVEDPAAELQTIKSEDGFEINRLEKVLDVLSKAAGLLPKKMQIEFLVKTLGKEEEWNADEILTEIAKEPAAVGKAPAPVNGNGVGV